MTNRICPFDQTVLTKVWEFVSGMATTKIKKDEESYWNKLLFGTSARAYPHVCRSCGFLAYFVEAEDLEKVFSE